jgi:hypothetical protein
MPERARSMAVDVISEFLHTGGPPLNADDAAIAIVDVLEREGFNLDRVRDARDDDEAAESRGRCVSHGEQEGDRDEGGKLRCPFVITDPNDCGYGDPCGRLLARPPQGEDHEAATVEKIIALIESNHGAYLIDKHRPEDLSAFIRGQFPSRDGTVAVHDAYVEPLDGGHRGYQARCWTCDWTGPEHLRGTETLGTEESRTHKRAAKTDAAAHRAGVSDEGGNQDDERRH